MAPFRAGDKPDVVAAAGRERQMTQEDHRVHQENTVVSTENILESAVDTVQTL